MKLSIDPHTHTSYSHGKNNAAEMIEKAAEMKLKGIYIAEHGPNHFYARNIGKDGYRALAEEVNAMKKKYPQMDIRFGYEANIISLDGELDVDQELIEMADFVSAGFHVLCKMKDIRSFFSILVLSMLVKKLKLKFLASRSEKKNTEAMIAAVRKYDIFMLTHPTSNFDVDITKVAKVCEERGTLLELNDPRGLLDSALVNTASRESMVNFMLGSDAHSVDRVGRVENALKTAIESGIDRKRFLNIIS